MQHFNYTVIFLKKCTNFPGIAKTILKPDESHRCALDLCDHFQSKHATTKTYPRKQPQLKMR